MIPLEDYHQLKFRFTDSIQDNYEVVRPVVLFAQTVSERRVAATFLRKYR
jgi:hypothetical protein